MAPCRETVHSVPDPRSNFTLVTILVQSGNVIGCHKVIEKNKLQNQILNSSNITAMLSIWKVAAMKYVVLLIEHSLQIWSTWIGEQIQTKMKLAEARRRHKPGRGPIPFLSPEKYIF